MTDKQIIQSLLNLSAALNRMLEPLQPFIQVMERISQAMERVSQAMTPFLEAVAPYIKYIEYYARYRKFIDSVHPTGWLPYHTVSMDFVEECGDDVSLLETRLEDFYENNWENIRQDIEGRIDRYHIAKETKATFREALSAHSVGHYRCVCCALFAVIEREFRINFFEDATGSIPSDKMLRELKNRGKLQNFLPREAYGWILFDRLVKHQYKQANNENRAQYEDDYVPNRHASIHGLVSYSTFKHSMNMIIMADYVFQILTSMAKLTSQVNRRSMNWHGNWPTTISRGPFPPPSPALEQT